MPDKNEKEVTQAFRPRARLLQLLGDQLIGSAKLAVFELVKNAYDADASRVDVWLRGLNGQQPSIVVRDDGQGMSLDTISNVWLVPGDDHRETQRAENRRSPKYGRLPLGEKGVGRFAVHKLGDRIQMVTRAAGSAECVVTIDWRDLIHHKYLEDAKVTVAEREAKTFPGEQTGTAIMITELRDKEWTRRDVRDLYRQVTSITSPFDSTADDFDIELHVPDHPDWIQSLPGVSELLERAPYVFKFRFSGGLLEYEYGFRGVPGIRVEKREAGREVPLQVVLPIEPDDLDVFSAPSRRKSRRLIADAETLRGIGPISGELYIFDRTPAILKKYGESRFLERYLDLNGGVRVYRDGIRIYNYGEPGDDWLQLDLGRVNTPTRSLSRNIVVGLVNIDLASSKGLKEKTNREGFVENETYDRFRRVVSGIVAAAATERSIDKEKLRLAMGGPRQSARDLEGPIGELRRIARKNDLGQALEPAIKKIESDYNHLRDNFLRAGISQAGLAVVFHELERGVNVLTKAIARRESLDELKQQADQLQSVLDISTQLIRKSESAEHSLRHLVRRARDLNSVRLRVHHVVLTCPALEDGALDASPVFPFGLVLGALTNLIDNAIYWMRVAKPEEDDDSKGERKRLYLDVDPDFAGGPAIIIADNGTGFIDEPSQVVEPFFSRRPDGMGLGLYYANMVMQLSGGQLVFPTAEEADVPEEFGGAVLALVFKGS